MTKPSDKLIQAVDDEISAAFAVLIAAEFDSIEELAAERRLRELLAICAIQMECVK